MEVLRRSIPGTASKRRSRDIERASEGRDRNEDFTDVTPRVCLQPPFQSTVRNAELTGVQHATTASTLTRVG